MLMDCVMECRGDHGGNASGGVVYSECNGKSLCLDYQKSVKCSTI